MNTEVEENVQEAKDLEESVQKTEETRQERAKRLFHEGYNCSQSVFAAYCDLYGMDETTALRVSASFGGGMGRMREVCGACSGMFMVAGMETGQTKPKDPQQKMRNYEIVQQMAEEFKKTSGGSIVCRELLGLDKKENHDPKPEARTKEYYQKRPCEQLVVDAVNVIEKVLFEKK